MHVLQIYVISSPEYFVQKQEKRCILRKIKANYIAIEMASF